MKLVIDKFINPKSMVKTRIPYESPVYPIYFLIYINRIFLKIEEWPSQIICLSFIDDLRFQAVGNSTLKIT